MTTGVSCRAVVFGLILILGGFSTGSGQAGPKEETAVIAGTVFREPGFALPGADITLTVKVPPVGGKAPKPQKARSDRRGEFAFYVPASKSSYVVTAAASGFQSAEKQAELNGGPERIDVYLELKQASK